MTDIVDELHVRGIDGIIRSLNEHYDGQRDVEQDPYGAWLAIQNQAAEITRLRAKLEKADALADAVDSDIPRTIAKALRAYREADT